MTLPARWLKILLFIQLGIVFLLLWPVWLNTYTPVSFILTESMAPTMPPGTMIFVRHDPSQGLMQYKNQVVVFYNPVKKMSICHRAVGIESNRLVTRGDNNPFADTFQPGEKNIIGRVVLALPPKIVFRWVPVVVGVCLGVLIWRRKKGK